MGHQRGGPDLGKPSAGAGDLVLPHRLSGMRLNFLDPGVDLIRWGEPELAQRPRLADPLRLAAPQRVVGVDGDFLYVGHGLGQFAQAAQVIAVRVGTRDEGAAQDDMPARRVDLRQVGEDRLERYASQLFGAVRGSCLSCRTRRGRQPQAGTGIARSAHSRRCPGTCADLPTWPCAAEPP